MVCNATRPRAVNVVQSISWQQTSPFGVIQILSHDGISTNITSLGLDDPASTSILSLYATSAGRWQYTCNVSLQVPGDPTISNLQSTEAIVKGEL